jgi:hypothetical protein
MNPVKQNLSFIEFSEEIIRTGDIDPDYIFLRNHLCRFGRKETIEIFKKKLLIYNLESELLYYTNQISADEIKFGNERRKQKRHFKKWERQLDRVDFEKVIQVFNGKSYLSFRNFFIKIDGMGDWASWKAADIMNKVFDVHMIFDDLTFLKAYEYPLKGLLMLNNCDENVQQYRNVEFYKKHINVALEISKKITPSKFFNAQEILTLETCLCKFHSYRHNKYKIGEDLHKIKKINENEKLKKYWGLI